MEIQIIIKFLIISIILPNVLSTNYCQSPCGTFTHIACSVSKDVFIGIHELIILVVNARFKFKFRTLIGTCKTVKVSNKL